MLTSTSTEPSRSQSPNLRSRERSSASSLSLDVVDSGDDDLAVARLRMASPVSENDAIQFLIGQHLPVPNRSMLPLPGSNTNPIPARWSSARKTVRTYESKDAA